MLKVWWEILTVWVIKSKRVERRKDFLCRIGFINDKIELKGWENVDYHLGTEQKEELDIPKQVFSYFGKFEKQNSEKYYCYNSSDYL